MDQSQRLELAKNITSGKVKIEDLSEAEQVDAFGSVFVKVDYLRKGEAEGHPFRGNQWTEGTAVRINADQHPLHGRTGKIKRVIPDAGIGGYTSEGKLKTGYEVSVPGIDGDTDVFGEGELEAEGSSNEDSSSSQALFDQQNVGGRDTHDSNTPYPSVPDQVREATGMTEDEFNHLDSKGMMKPWGPSKEGQAELERLRGGSSPQSNDQVRASISDSASDKKFHRENKFYGISSKDKGEVEASQKKFSSQDPTYNYSIYEWPTDYGTEYMLYISRKPKGSGSSSDKPKVPRANRMDTADEIRAAAAAERKAKRGSNWKAERKAAADWASKR